MYNPCTVFQDWTTILASCLCRMQDASLSTDLSCASCAKRAFLERASPFTVLRPRAYTQDSATGLCHHTYYIFLIILLRKQKTMHFYLPDFISLILCHVLGCGRGGTTRAASTKPAGALRFSALAANLAPAPAKTIPGLLIQSLHCVPGLNNNPCIMPLQDAGCFSFHWLVMCEESFPRKSVLFRGFANISPSQNIFDK